MSSVYHRLFSWRYPVTSNVVGHADGAVSVMVAWSGFSFEMMDFEERYRATASLYQALVSLDPGLVMENHCFRYYDNNRATDYIEYANKAVRQPGLARKTRSDLAQLLSRHAMTNQLVTVFTLHGSKTVRVKKYFKAQVANAEKIVKIIRPFLDRMPKARLASIDEFGEIIQRSNDPYRAREKRFFQFDHRFHLNDQWCSKKPEFADGFLRHNNTYIWIGLLDLYPDRINPGWAELLLNSSGAEYQLVQIIRAGNTRKEIADAERIEKEEQQNIGMRGGTFVRGKVRDIQSFRIYLADNGIPVLNNTYMIRFQHTDLEHMNRIKNSVLDSLASSGARAQDAEKIQRYCWRIMQPGQGYQCAFERPDAADLVMNMAPFNNHDKGVEKPLFMRLSAQHELVYFDLPDNAANHSFTAGKTRSGKGAEKVLRILETYPMGIDQYVIEYGGSYRWVIKALEGNYLTIDPDTMFINPLPTYEEVQQAKAASKFAQLSAFIINSMALILTGGKTEFDQVEGGNHHISRAQQVFDYLYDEDSRIAGRVSPRLGDFLHVIETVLSALEDKDGQDARSFRFLYENLNSFLASPTGSKFNSDKDGLDLTGDCIGIDIKPLVDSGDKQLLAIYLVSIFMRITNKVISNRQRAEMAIDEYHIPAELVPELTASITSRGVKTWAKENSHLEVISQSPEHFKVARDVLDQINHRQFMYMENGHEEAQHNFRIPNRAYQIWRNLTDPSIEGLPYRHAIRQFGRRTYHLLEQLPDWVLILADTRAKALDIKDRIDREMPDADVWARIERFKELEKGGNNKGEAAA